jgi:hypothetical protein
VAAPFAVIVDAVSFFASGGLISLIRKQEQSPSDRSARRLDHEPAQEIAEGPALRPGNRYLRMIAGSTGTSNLRLEHGLRDLPGLRLRGTWALAGAVGAAFGIGSIGILLGAWRGALARRFGVGPVIVGSMFITDRPFFLPPSCRGRRSSRGRCSERR